MSSSHLDDPPVDAHDAYLRLHLLSHRLIRPHGANLDGVFGLLNNVVWTEPRALRRSTTSKQVRLRCGPPGGGCRSRRSTSSPA